jgi:3-oxoacyl-[acyl-carrier protein] reductase
MWIANCGIGGFLDLSSLRVDDLSSRAAFTNSQTPRSPNHPITKSANHNHKIPKSRDHQIMIRTTLITGGTRGIGYALAEALLQAGDRVAITGTSTDSVMRAEHALATACGDSGRVTGIVCDVRDPASAELAVRTAAAKFGGFDVLVNNAGVGVGVPISDLSHDEWERIIGTNLTGVFNCCKAAIPVLRQRGGGWIVNVSSLASKNPFVGGAAYCASKAGLNAFSEALMQELRPDNIRVTYILPGSVATGFSGRANDAGAEWKLHPEDVAQAIVDVLNHPARSLPSRVEIRPSRPQKS